MLPQKKKNVSLAQNAIVQTHRRKLFIYQSYDRLSESLTANLWLLEQFSKAALCTLLDLFCFGILLWAGCWARSAFSTTWYNHSYAEEQKGRRTPKEFHSYHKAANLHYWSSSSGRSSVKTKACGLSQHGQSRAINTEACLKCRM